MIHEDLAALRERNAARRSLEKLNPKLSLQTNDVLAEGGLGNRQSSRRGKEGAFFRNRQEIAKLPQVHVSIPVGVFLIASTC